MTMETIEIPYIPILHYMAAYNSQIAYSCLSLAKSRQKT